ncbi:P-loop containing nucleoside triphosphate hydrolase protein [Boletus reticuloceps]|uniref:P-loop containing nucleoside triphosphate hydrolase protein n=1 Tax=Boletus reticuloceps TaxID=495285 RepID=A0A8I2YRZ7_9AGAM|nr:P-loop containing nucleoside triphosphate hydrolase protein [Boletus reticuloceps]
MAKRRNVVDSDDDAPESSQASKRARTEDSDELAQGPAPFLKRERKAVINGKGKGKGEDHDSDDEDEEEDFHHDEQPNEEEEKKFEEDHGEAIRCKLEQRRNTIGSIAEHGIIEFIEIKQFMCHPHLTFTFGPQVNFIIGGKSAILSAITIALGGKSISTGRGSGLKSFIREGQQRAEVTIVLKNQGEEAYKPKEYGKSIVIRRVFSRDGVSSWKITSKDGAVISTKRDELAAICDHMNIQVDNPMNVLTQDAARQFLNASHPSDKYKFFLRGTQLSQLSEEYDTCLDNINQTKKLLYQKKQVLPDLRAAFKEATARFQEASKAREQRFKADELKKELAWAHVAAKQGEMEAKFEELAKAERRLPRIEAELQTAESQFQLASQEVERYEKEHSELGNIDHLNAQRTELQEKLRVNKNKLRDFRNDQDAMNASLAALNKAINDYEEKITEEARRLEAHTQVKRDEINRRLDTAKEAVAEADRRHKDTIDQKRNKLTERDEVKSKGQAAEGKKHQLQERITDCQTMINKCKEQEKNSLAPYGHDIKGVLQSISKTHWHGDTPIGPLGLYVKLKDPKWAQLLRAQLGNLMTSFACTDARDRQQLKRILDQSKNFHVNVIISERDLFDYRAGEPREDVLTVLRALDVSDPYVLRVFINAANIERTVLAADRRVGDDNLKSLAGGGVAWTADHMRVTRYPEGGGSSINLPRVNANDPRRMLFTTSDLAARRDWEKNLHAAESEYKATQADVNHCRQVYDSLCHEIEKLSTLERKAYEDLRMAKTSHTEIQEEANEEMPAGISGLQNAKDAPEAEKVSVLEQYANLAERKTVIDAQQATLLKEMNGIKEQIQNFEQHRSGIMGKIEEAATNRLDAQKNQQHYHTKLEAERKKVADIDAIAKTLQEEFTNWSEQAESYCERYENPRKVAEVQRQLDSVQAALKERERRHGATIEELTIEVNKARADLDSAERDIRSLSALNHALRNSLIVRLDRWHEFRRHIALRCKLVFQYHLSERGYYGKVLFDHVNQTLQLKVQTDDQTMTQGRDKDPRSLSGGEKSFSTICLLLSLWDSIGCPLRCLDEFDVFMDAVNRRISMRMIIDTANASDKKQYILITPQDMGNIQPGSSVKVHKMRDPERGQRTLDFR